MSFTWFDKITESMAYLDREQQDEVITAIARYGMFGEEPDLPPLLMALYTSIKEDIDHSKDMRARGSRGGRPKQGGEDAPEAPAEEAEKHAAKQGSNKVKNQAQNQVSNQGENQVPNHGEEPAHETQYSAIQGNTVQCNTGGGRADAPKRAKARRFKAPTAGQVEAYAKSKGLSVDADRFCDFYASKGWKVGRSPMRDWHAAVRNWARRDASPRPTVTEGVYADVEQYSHIV